MTEQLKTLNVQEANKLIAKYLGYEYVSSVNPAHEHPNGINHGYWRLKPPLTFEKLNRFGKFGLVMHGAQLHYHESYTELMKIIDWIEEHDECTFYINGKNVFVVEPLREQLTVDVTYPSKKEAIWNAIVGYIKVKNEIN